MMHMQGYNEPLKVSSTLSGFKKGKYKIRYLRTDGHLGECECYLGADPGMLDIEGEITSITPVID